MPLQQVDPDDEVAVAASVELFNTARSLDDPDCLPELPELVALQLRYGWELEPEYRFLYTPDGGREPVGVASVYLPEHDNQELVQGDLTIAPRHRRHGHGTAMLTELLHWVRDSGRSTLWLYAGDEDDAAATFLTGRGFSRLSHEARRIQRLAEVDPAVVAELRTSAEKAAQGYRLERHSPPSPDRLLEELVRVTAAINDAPMGDLAYEPETFDLERVRALEVAAERKHARLYRVIARRISDGEMGGHTVLIVASQHPSAGDQYDTAVARDHRGHRLGLLLKIEMMRWLAEAEPQLERIETLNQADNDFMITVNERLAYRLSRTFDVYQLRLD